MNESVKVFNFGSTKSRVAVGNATPSMDELLKEAFGSTDRTCLIVCDTNTAPIARVATEGGASNRFATVILAPGEDSKGWASVQSILEAGVAAGLGRDGVIVAFGGGVVCDIAAFAASVYMRGTGLILVPTTLLAMVDAAVGGKTGFDLFGLKNLVGTFRPADLVHAPVSVLSSLSDREWRSGLAEVLKTAVLEDLRLFQLLENQREQVVAGPAGGCSMGTIQDMVASCIQVKGRIVEADPTETGTERALLNLGHTFGHALEAVAGLGALTHGEAVAWGIARACALARVIATMPHKLSGDKEPLPFDAPWVHRILHLLDSYGYDTSPIHPAALAAADAYADRARRLLLEAMSKDKKKKAGSVRFIVPTVEPQAAIHGASLYRPTQEEVLRALE